MDSIKNSLEFPNVGDDSLEHSTSKENIPGYSKDNNIVTSDSYENLDTLLDKNESIMTEKLNILKLNDELDLTHSESSCGSPQNKTIFPSNESALEPEKIVESTESFPDWCQKEWKEHQKHVFVLSSSGKPIYTRYGDADDQASLFGTLLTLSQFLQHSQQDTLKCIKAGNHTVAFLTREHVVLILVKQTLAHQMPEPPHSLLLQLSYVYNQVVSILTLSRLRSIYEQRPNYDLRRLLSGAEKFIDYLLDSMDNSPGYLLKSIRCLPLESSLRESIAQAILSHVKIPDLVFAIMLAGNQLIALVRMRQFLLHPLDLHLLCNLVSSSESFKQAESWTPICLPMFNSNGYLHTHVSYLDEACRVCLLLFSVNNDAFYALSECRNKIKEKMVKNNSMRQLIESLPEELQTFSPALPSAPMFSAGYTVADTGIKSVLHFIYKARTTGQYTQPDYTHPYSSSHDVERLFSLFKYIYCFIHTPGKNLKIYYHTGARESILVWIESTFELFTTFNPLISKNTATQTVFKLLKWIKKEESKLFILNSHTI